MKQHIEVWHDTTSQPGIETWNVSLCGEDGSEIRLLGAYELHRDADRAARLAHLAYSIPVFERNENGELTAQAA